MEPMRLGPVESSRQGRSYRTRELWYSRVSVMVGHGGGTIDCVISDLSGLGSPLGCLIDPCCQVGIEH